MDKKEILETYDGMLSDYGGNSIWDELTDEKIDKECEKYEYDLDKMPKALINELWNNLPGIEEFDAEEYNNSCKDED